MSSETEGIIAMKLHVEIAKNEEQRRKLLMQNVAYLSEMKKKNLYKAVLGDESAPWSAYLGQLEIFYSRNEINNYLRINDKFIIELDLAWSDFFDVTRSRLFDMLPIVDKSNVEELLSMARVMTSQDWTNEMRVRRGKVSLDDCPHAFIEYNICEECGSKHKKSATYHE